MPSPSDPFDGPFSRFRRQADHGAPTLGVRFADALTDGDGARAEQIALEGRRSGLSVAAVHARVITPALYVIGDLWQQGEISEADEHLATVICHRVLAALHATMRGGPRGTRAHVMLATPAGQRHAIGLRMAADVLEGAGYRVTYLGADVPSQALRHAVRRHEPAVLALSLTTPDGLVGLEQAIDAALAARPDTAILLGGQAVPAELVGSGVGHVDSVEFVVEAVERLIAADAPVRRPARPGAPLTIAAPRSAGSAEEQLATAAAEIADIARQQARLAERYRMLAFEDELCGLPNRRAFDDRFRELAEVHRARDAPPLTVMLLDLDGFKRLNDDLGHDAGDVAMRMIAGALRSQLRELDLPARLGGDEFGALLPGVDCDAALRVAERVCAAIRTGFAGDPPPLTASCGVARFDGDRRRTLIRADKSLYDAKRAGGDRVQLAS